MTLDTPAVRQRPVFGFVGFIFGALALILVLVQFSAGPFAPRQSSGVSIGEVAADIREAAKRKLTGQPAPPPVAAPWDVDRVMKLGAMVLAGVAVIVGAIALLRQEPSPLAITSITFGASAVLMQFLIWLALLVVGMVIILAIIKNMDGILGT